MFIAHIRFTGEHLEAFPLRSRRQGCQPLTSPSEIVLKIPDGTVRQVKEVKDTQIGKEGIK